MYIYSAIIKGVWKNILWMKIDFDLKFQNEVFKYYIGTKLFRNESLIEGWFIENLLKLQKNSKNHDGNCQSN